MIMLAVMSVAIMMAAGWLLVRYWRHQERRRRKKLVKLLEQTAADYVSSPEEQTTAPSPTGNLEQAPPATSRQCEALIARLRDQMNKTGAACRAVDDKYTALGQAKSELECAHSYLCGYRFTGAYAYDTLAVDFQSNVDRWLATRKQMRESRAALQDLLESFPAARKVFGQELARLQPLVRKVSRYRAAHPPTTLAAAQKLAVVMYHKWDTRLASCPSCVARNCYNACATLLQTEQPAAFVPAKTEEPPGLDQLATAITNNVAALQAALSNLVELVNDWNHRSKKYEMISTDFAPAWPETFEEFVKILDNERTRKMAMPLAELEAASLLNVDSLLEAAEESVHEKTITLTRYQETLRTANLEAHPQLDAMKHVLHGWLQKVDEHRKHLQSGIAQVRQWLQDAAAPCDEQEDVYKNMLAELEKHLLQATSAFYAVIPEQEKLKACLEELKIHRCRYKSAVIRPQKPTESEVAQFLNSIEDWSKTHLQLSRKAFAARESMRTRMEEFRSANLSRAEAWDRYVAFKNSNSIPGRRLRPTESLLRSANDWLIDKVKKLEQADAPYQVLQLECSTPGTVDSDAATVAALREAMRSYSFAQVQYELAFGKKENARKAEEPTIPDAPQIPHGSEDADFGQLIDDMERYLVKLVERQAQMKELTERRIAAFDAAQSRRETLVKRHSALQDAAGKAGQALHANSSEELRVLLCAVKFLKE